MRCAGQEQRSVIRTHTSVLAKMQGSRTRPVVDCDRSSIKGVVERNFEKSLCNETLHVVRVPPALLTQGLNENVVCEKRRAGVVCVCVCRKGRTGEGRCI